ncbi:hypothetical protein DTO96_102495 [Ephemeroptericola cinctiostellae]|uniref:Uncharacterized protein n=1 Tax=Ephemeroptericola cinctiostellae TaxID=2268024 RepID=A0A345DEF1_9BURK|nr:hypothetical protein DTO96_102495 [Ephemeroptericola cinctiostellae]
MNAWAAEADIVFENYRLKINGIWVFALSLYVLEMAQKTADVPYLGSACCGHIFCF